jgi:hypothetical protein
MEEKGYWADVEYVRRMMKERGLQKASGSSLVHQGDIMMIEGSLEVEAEVQNEDGHNAVQSVPVIRPCKIERHKGRF